MLTRQQIFDRAWEGLKLQNFEQCTNSSGICQFSNEAGRRCAIGWVNPQLTNESDNFRTIWHSDIGHFKSLVDYDDLGLLEVLRQAHDGSSSPAEMRENMVQLAAKYKFTIPDV
jgi:hypothetical protein